MKKLSVLAVLAVIPILLTGCGSSKTLTCTNTQEQSGVKMDQKVVMKFSGNKVNYIKMSVDSKATSDVIKNNWDVFASTLEKQYSNKDKDGVKVTTKNNKKDYSYEISIEFDLKKATNENLKEYDLDGIADEKSSMSDVKKSAEKSGFTCK